jgi:hypothetical protein
MLVMRLECSGCLDPRFVEKLKIMGLECKRKSYVDTQQLLEFIFFSKKELEMIKHNPF